MNSKERFYSMFNYEGYDRPPTKYYGTPEITQDLIDHFHLSDHEELLLQLGDDFRHVSPEYDGPELKTFDDGSREGIWGERYKNISFDGGTYPEASYLPFADVEDVEELEDYRFPTPDWYDYGNVKEDCEKYSDYVIEIEGAGTPDFMNGIARCRGVEKVLFDVGLEEPVFLKLMEQRFEFFYEKIKRTLEAAEGLVDVVAFGEDLGNQNGLLIHPDKYDKLFVPYMEKLFDLAHQYDAITMMHCCGSCFDLIPRFIEMGLDILEVVQVDAEKMDIEKLHENFYKKIAFCGSMSVQQTLPFGTKEDVIREVKLRKKLFADGGMVIAPTHAIQVGTPLENIITMYDEIGSLQQ